MPYASGPSVRRLSKIATLLLARNYIVMLQRTVDELRRLVVDPARRSGNPSTTTPPPGSQPAESPGGQSSADGRASTPQNVDATTHTHHHAAGRPLPPAALPAEVILAMTSLPPAVMNERLRSYLSARGAAGGAVDWSTMSAAAVGWRRELPVQRHAAGGPLTTADYVAIRPRNCHPGASVSAGGALLLPWTDCVSPMPLMAARLQPSHFI